MEKINFLVSNKGLCNSSFSYKMNNNVATEKLSSVVKETKSKNSKFDWLNIENIIEFAQKTNSAKDKLLKTEIKSFCPDTIANTRRTKIEKEKNHIAKPITERTAYNTKQLKAAGVKDNDIKRYLTYDGHVNDAGKKILKEHGKSYK